ncbi:MAG: hypothetical protein SGI71_03360 [Verrucomicrobiota bacterium]|nr:hypothetical protein [Verrucomicrobiota bacterium]
MKHLSLIFYCCLFVATSFAQDASTSTTTTTTTTTTPDLVPPVTGDAAATSTATGSSDRRNHIVIEYVDQDLNAVLRGLARRAGLNLVIGQNVTGTVTIRLVDVSYEDAIKIITQSHNLIFTKDEVLNVAYVKNSADRQQEQTEPDSYTFNYASVTDPNLLSLVQRILKSGQTPVADTRTNRIFYNESVSNKEAAKQKIAELDTPIKQVMIETRVASMSLNRQQDYGIDWSGVFSSFTISSGFGNRVGPGNIGGNPFSAGDVFNIFKPINPAQAFAILTPSQFSVTLSFFNTDSDAKLIASPRVVVLDNQTATIDINTRQNITFAVASTASAATTSAPPAFDAISGSRLQITPSINNRNFIRLRVIPTISSFTAAPGANTAGLINLTTSGAFQTIINPTVSISTMETSVYLKSGNTLAVGGLTRDAVDKSFGKVPVIGDLPGIGYLFQNRSNRRVKQDVLIFVTPTVIWDPTDTTPGLEMANTTFESQYTKMKTEKVSDTFVADEKGWKNNAKGAFKVLPDPSDEDDQKVTRRVRTTRTMRPAPVSELTDVPPSGTTSNSRRSRTTRSSNTRSTGSTSPSSLMRITPSLSGTPEAEGTTTTTTTIVEPSTDSSTTEPQAEPTPGEKISPSEASDAAGGIDTTTEKTTTTTIIETPATAVESTTTTETTTVESDPSDSSSTNTTTVITPP